MSMWWVINKETKEMIHSCDDAGKEYCSIGGDQEWLECVEGTDPGNNEVVEIDGVLSLQVSTAKSSPQWDAFRASRDKKLTECDWTQGSDSPLASEAKTNWALYRIYLRELPQSSSIPDISIIQTFAEWMAAQ